MPRKRQSTLNVGYMDCTQEADVKSPAIESSFTHYVFNGKANQKSKFIKQLVPALGKITKFTVTYQNQDLHAACICDMRLDCKLGRRDFEIVTSCSSVHFYMKLRTIGGIASCQMSTGQQIYLNLENNSSLVSNTTLHVYNVMLYQAIRKRKLREMQWCRLIKNGAVL